MKNLELRHFAGQAESSPATLLFKINNIGFYLTFFDVLSSSCPPFDRIENSQPKLASGQPRRGSWQKNEGIGICVIPIYVKTSNTSSVAAK
ncbi:hypothetical protein [Collimonas fungivorans]|uniref:hypothetical protein n=1 Tax=Collimonas fungivorans TaxID=158899 RepID=UPI0011D1B86B|nr:hypothetical protein [Collimonas fungivorans]